MTKAYLEIDEVIKLEEAATSLRDHLLIRLLFYLGCRVSELLAIAVQDIDFAAGAVTIQHLKLRMKLSCALCSARLSKGHVYCPKCGLKVVKPMAEEKGHSWMRALPIDGDTQVMLKEYIKGGGPAERGGKKLIFGISRNRAWQIIKECAESAGLPKLIQSESGKSHNISPQALRDAHQRQRTKDKS
jgi:integrase/recombinase XerD